MADTSVLDPFSTPKETNRAVPQQIGGSMELPPDLGFEVKTPLNSISSGVGEILQDVFSLGQEVAGIEPKTVNKEAGKFSSGSIEFNSKDQEAARQRMFFEAMGADQARTQQAHNRFVVEEEIRALSETMSEEEGNELMHLQTNYAKEHTQNAYGMWNKRVALMERSKHQEKQQKQVSIAQTQSRPSSLQTAFEGGSGKQGNLSFQATG